MSVHGDQYILPLFLKESSGRPFLKKDDELAVAFHLLTRDLHLNGNHNVLSFAKLLWPFLAIQGITKPYSTHIILDGLKVFSKKSKFTNPPRKPLLGHVLRNIDERNEIELLNRIKNILTYQDSEAEEIGEGSVSEYQAFELPSLTSPEFINSIKKLLPNLQYKSLEGFIPLDASLSTEEALDISEEYRNTIQQLKGNANRWKEQIELIGDELESLLKDIKVRIMDVERRYNSEIERASNSISDEEVENQLENKQDNINLWKRTEKKKVTENVASLFKTLNRNMEEILKKNKFYSNPETLSRSSFGDLVPKIKNQFDSLRTEISEILTQVDTIENKFEIQKERAEDINIHAKEQLEQLRSELTEQLESKDDEISRLEKEKEENVQKLEDLRARMEALFTEIKRIIISKRRDCLDEVDELVSWSIKDEDAPTIKKPIQWFYMPLYVMFVEDEDMMEEKMEIVFPGYVLKDSDKVYEDLSDLFSKLDAIINDKIENDMPLRSNFEFTAENNNLLKDPKFRERIEKGVRLLEEQGFIFEVERGVNKNLGKIL
ncbi:MAG: hypothetical protein EU541_00545 [Promethearchaeota archaeon]|nr:MAG: hypothetical protein EU541_00545 [Candidatus Lokiarchaeota archaeon]